MTGDDTPRERLVRVEEQVKHVSTKVDDIHSKVEQMYEAYVQGKGAVRVVRAGQYFAAGLIGYVATYLPKISAIIGGLPK